MPTPSQEQIAELAYQMWQQRGCPQGSSERDWQQAEALLLATPEKEMGALIGFSSDPEGHPAGR